MIRLQCDLCRHLLDPSDTDAVTDGKTSAGERADVCGPCMRDAADRVLSRLRASAKVLDPTPPTVRERARSMDLPGYLTRRRR